MEAEVTRLENGLRVVTVPMKQVYSVAIAVLVGVGSRHESFDTNGGVSHFLEHLLFKGTKKRPTTKIISELVDGVGGIHNAYTTNDLTNYYIKLPARHAALAVDILADMIRHPLLDATEVDRERGVVIEEMNVYRDDPARYIHDLIPELLWPHDPLGREVIGSQEIIQTISRDAIADYQATHYSPDNMVVAFAGSVEHGWAVEQAKQLMGDMVATKRPTLAGLDDRLSEQLVKPFAKETNQAHLVIGAHGYPYDAKHDMAARVMSNILGAGLSSRLFIEVRERQGLAYTVYADYHNFTDTGLFEVYGGVNLDKTEQALESIMHELDKLRHEPVGEAELTKVKNKMSGSLQMSLENTFAVADRFGTRLLLLDRLKTVEETLQQIEAVTPEQILEASRELLAPEKLRLAIIAPEPEPVGRKFETLVKETK